MWRREPDGLQRDVLRRFIASLGTQYFGKWHPSQSARLFSRRHLRGPVPFSNAFRELESGPLLRPEGQINSAVPLERLRHAPARRAPPPVSERTTGLA